MVQVAIVTPVLLGLAMGKRTQKMLYSSSLLVFAYWFIAALDAIELLETAMFSKSYKHVIFTTEAVVSIAIILANSYAVVTLCGYLTPVDTVNLKKFGYCKKFDFLYKAVVGSLGMFFCEIPLLTARIQILFTDVDRIVYGTFFLWIVKNVTFTLIIVFIVFVKRIRKKFSRIPCRPSFDSDSAIFNPEKRDTYIYSHQQLQAGPSALKKQNSIEKELNGKKRVTFKMDELRKLTQPSETQQTKDNPVKPSHSAIEVTTDDEEDSSV